MSLVEALVCFFTFQSSKTFYIRAKFDIVKSGLVFWQVCSSAVPSRLKRPHVVRPLCYVLRICITAHESDAGDHRAVTVNETVEKIGGQFLADIFRQMGAVTAGTVAGTSREIKGECYLARNLLKNYVEGSDFKLKI